MFGFSRTIRRRTARGLLTLVSGLWLLATAAPCVMAATHCPGMNGVPCESMDHALPADIDCDSLQAIDCQRADVALTDRNATPDLQIVPVLLTTVSPAVYSDIFRFLARDPDRLVARLSPPTLYLLHTALLI